MKKLVVFALLVVGLTTFAQEGRKRGEGKEKLPPEQRVEKQLEKMTKDLNLNEKQTAQVKELLTKENAERQAKKAEMEAKRADGTKPTPEEKMAMKEKIDQRIVTHKAEMKKILNADQYTKWEQNFEQRKEKMKEKIMERKGDKKKKED
ncbi:hypothetical protein OX283_008885 [Flavobacterium sp. SUN052]|uniref:hypothetical protein n=1 Tax=Flavobacterium sp. SUN052 TaxID=3002441 RepID=UPI00237D7A40|nr:hypothetical protein [Flavobacterium sp. SUN052]MEC4004771.1 hypothetical protein [Flavobacterium sp. SUN052]